MPSLTWENLPAAKRTRVLDAAMAELGAHGYSAGSLTVVAREAGIAKGSLFQYFADKTDLFSTVAEHAATVIRAAMDVRFAALDLTVPFFDLLEQAVTAWMDLFDGLPLERGMIAATQFELDPEVRTLVRSVAHRHYREVFDVLVGPAVERSELAADADVEVLASWVLLMLPHLALAPVVPSLEPVLPMFRADPKTRLALAHRLVVPLRRAFGPR